ncbi:Hypothetical predicted protein, partial [Scomber scombrus]
FSHELPKGRKRQTEEGFTHLSSDVENKTSAINSENGRPLGAKTHKGQLSVERETHKPAGEEEEEGEERRGGEEERRGKRRGVEERRHIKDS